MSARAITARPHIAGTVFSNLPDQDRIRATARQVDYHHAEASYHTATEHWYEAWTSGDRAAEQKWLEARDFFSAQLDALEEQDRSVTA